MLLQQRVGYLEKPFRISLEYTANGNRSVAAVDSFAMKNCSTGKYESFFSLLCWGILAYLILLEKEIFLYGIGF